MGAKVKFASRAEWLDGRLKGIGASEWAEIMRDYLPEEDREYLYSSPYKIYCEKAGVVPPKDLSDNESCEWGLRHEASIAQAVMDRTGRRVVLSEDFSMYRDEAKPWLQASPDAFQLRPDRDDPGVLQIKTAAFFMRKHWTDESGNMAPPLPFKIQTLGEMRVAGCRWGSLVVLVGGNRLFGPFDFERNEAFIDKAEPVLDAFWKRVLERDPPPVVGCEADGEVLKSLYPETAGKVIDLPQECLDLVEQWKEHKAVRLQAEKAEKKIKTLMAGYMQDSAVGILPNGKKLLYPTRERSGYEVAPTSYRQFCLG